MQNPNIGLDTNRDGMDDRFDLVYNDNDGGYIRDAAVLHDYLYSVKSDDVYPDITREIADRLIIEGMKDLGASWVKQQAVYWALRSAGWAAYKTGLLP